MLCLFNLRFPVYVDVLKSTDICNEIDSIFVANVNLSIENPVLSLAVYKRLRVMVNNLIKSDTEIVSIACMYVLDTDRVLLDRGKEVATVEEDEEVIARLPVLVLPKTSVDFLFQNFPNGGGVN